ncbi:alpha/beta-type small acid-soluble spore protein [Tissierella pigra]|uniref:Small, acid-soluble spore protein, alpha/beta type n=1 Tax=Tissierella pigra TaxID=2607614 RepID=A0A6N7Y2G4_9FIRM|nr:small, acid-soluble spore protein, alpha/beta type [Tissierella pigra]MBU5424820.1 alpha/beta-type small acid-soluble spore protein [Tissierella pigra]MSU02220.1 small, acid-soluble spore protein, alpha/beta type [Tissierella pigra]
MGRMPIDSNAIIALNEMKMEIAKELGLGNNITELDPVQNIFTAGTVGGLMTRNLVEIGQKNLINKENK